MARSLTYIWAILLALGFFLVPAISGAQLTGDEVKIGVITSKAGVFAAFGQSQEIAAKLAEEEINGAGGIRGVRLKLIITDDSSKPDEAINLTRKLITQDVLVIIGPFGSTQGERSFPVAVRAEVPNISPTASKVGLTAKNRPWAFTFFTTSNRTYKPLVDRWVDDNGTKTVGVIYDNFSFIPRFDAELIFPPMLKAKGVEIVETVTFKSGDVDFSAQVTKVLAKKPDGVIISADYGEGGSIAREMRKQGFKGTLMGGVGLYHPKFVEIGGSGADGTYSVSTFWLENPDPKVQQFVKGYRAKAGGKDPEATAAHIYDVIYALKEIIETSGVTNKPEDVKKDRERTRIGLEKLKDFRGVTGSVTINEEGDAVRAESFVLKVKEGRFQKF